MQNLVAKALAVHQAIYEHSRGWIGHRLVFGMPTLLLHTVGRKTGKSRTAALTYGRDGDRYLITASNGGSPRPPGWLANLAAQPDCEIQIGRTHHKVRARIVLPKDPEYPHYWDIVNRVNRGQYREYQKRTTRDLAIVELTPRT
ncbi:MAG TPA: nitroreductase family deazaflavin-dependent oxidoreductase [Aldersonia sp.]